MEKSKQKPINIAQFIQQNHQQPIQSDKTGLQQIASTQFEIEQGQQSKVNYQQIMSGIQIGSRSSVNNYMMNQYLSQQQERSQIFQVNIEQQDKKSSFLQETGNPYDVNLVDTNEAILYQGEIDRFHFNENEPFMNRYIIITKSAIRIYENKNSILQTYTKPILAIPLKAVNGVDRIKFDIRDDLRFEHCNEQTIEKTKYLFEFLIKDDFLPIYTHSSYAKMFKDSQIAMELSPDKKKQFKQKDQSNISQQSPMRESNISKRSQISNNNGSPQKKNYLDMHKKTGYEVRQSPSKGSKIAMKYINSYTDVGPLIKPTPITQQDLIEMANAIDKKELFVKSDLRLIFSISDFQLVDETIETLTRILQRQ